MSPQFELCLFGTATAIGFFILGFAAGVILMTYVVTAPCIVKSKSHDGA